MTAPVIEPGYPLAWPQGRPRTAQRKPALFRHEGARMTLTSARRRLAREIGAMTPYGRPWRVTDIVLSTNIRFTASGARDQNVSRREPVDTGVALYFALDDKPHVLACDRWDTVYDNIAAIAAHIDALRGQERWGVANLTQAFAGHVALPAPNAAAAGGSWREALGFAAGGGVTLGEVEARYRERAQTQHPDRGGDPAAMARLNAARDAARTELRG